MKARNDIRNIAIIAHVDHGKTTIIDAILKQTGVFRDNQKINNQIMDSNDLEKERGITIFSKNASFFYKDVKINIVDTPGHADFSGEVERVLSMVDGALLLVDAFDGPMPQTKYVLRKALEQNLKILVVINKIDRPRCRPMEVLDMIYDLFIDIGADEEQLDFPYVFTSGKEGIAKNSLDEENNNIYPLLDKVIKEIPAPIVDENLPFQMLVSSIDYNDYLGRIAIGKIFKGRVSSNENLSLVQKGDIIKKFKVQKLFGFSNLNRVEIENAYAGDIVAICGIDDVNIGDTIADPEFPEALPYIKVDEPTISVNFMVNTSPFAGKEGKYVTSRHLRDRLYKELLSNLALKVEDTESTEVFKVSGRGELHLSILMETMRREGYEFAVSSPEVIYKNENGIIMEPLEEVVCDVPQEYVGVVIEKLGNRKAEMQNMENISDTLTRLTFHIPTRGLIGYSSEFKTDTRGEGIISHVLIGYTEFKGEIKRRKNGAIISIENGVVTNYSLDNLDDRGIFFVSAGTNVYPGMIIGEHNKDTDLTVNITKTKKLTNIRAAGADENIKIKPPRILSLEEALEWINNDELVEITPKSIRLRKKILDENERKQYEKKLKLVC
ncbi:MAG: GTP-binding protein [Candidatus Sericytochromatia bacterium]|nr:MAG: GTP-binding protein [Candidatus Sericytochromatia bacterium]